MAECQPVGHSSVCQHHSTLPGLPPFLLLEKVNLLREIQVTSFPPLITQRESGFNLSLFFAVSLHRAVQYVALLCQLYETTPPFTSCIHSSDTLFYRSIQQPSLYFMLS